MTEKNSYQKILEDVLAAARQKDYAGYGKFDALNSPALQELTFDNPWLRLFWIQLVKSLAVNVRPLLGVERSRNPKGIALFVRAWLFLHQLTGDERYLWEATALADWLVANPSPGQKFCCWGYNFAWQDVPPFYQKKGEPNCIVTVFAGEALMQAYQSTGQNVYLDAARSAGDFLRYGLPVLKENETEKALAYTLGREDAIVLNSQVLAAAFLAKIWKVTREEALLELSRKLINFTYNRRTSYDAWFYTDPPGKSPIRHDNYHTGGILDGLLEYYEATGDDRYNDGYWRGLEYYQRHLFEADGAPRWMNDRRYPHDVHGSAQGMITFTKAAGFRPEYRDQARLIADWAIKHLYRPRSRDFAYRRGRFMTWDYSLMRWCNAWMARALGEYLCL